MVPTMAIAKAQFEVHVSNDTFKFNAAHFVAYENYRERLHGHNYRVSVRLLGERQNPSPGSTTRILGADGYLMDFTNVKKVTKHVCQQLNEHFLCPMYSNVLKVTSKTLNSTPYIQLECVMDGTQFLFPEQDCVLLPIVHATAEELAIYVFCEIIHQLRASYLLERNVHVMEITIAEAVGQEAVFRHPIPTEELSSWPLDVREFIMTGSIVPMPCLSLPTIRTESMTLVEDSVQFNDQDGCKHCSVPNCQGSSLDLFSEQLQRIVDAINDGSIRRSHSGERPVTVNDLQQMLKGSED